MPERQPALHSDTEIYRAVIALAKFSLEAVRQMPRDVKQLIGNLLRDETLWMGVLVRDRAVLANVVRRRGFAVDHKLTKAYL